MCHFLQGVQVGFRAFILGSYSPSCRYTLVEKHLIEYSSLAMQRPDFKKTDDMFNRVLGKDHIAVVALLENKETGSRLIVANTHLHWDPAFRDVKLVQAALLVEEVERITHNFARYPPRLPPASASAAGTPTTPTAGENNASSRPPPVYTDGSKIPVIICGDFNSVPESGVYEFLSNGTVPPDHEDFMSHLYGKYTSEGIRHRLGLKSAYASVGELPLTNFTPGYKGHIDYIWHSAANLSVNSVLGEVDPTYLDKVVGFPNAHFPSEYVVYIYAAVSMVLMVVRGQPSVHRVRVPRPPTTGGAAHPRAPRIPRVFTSAYIGLHGRPSIRCIATTLFPCPYSPIYFILVNIPALMRQRGGSSDPPSFRYHTPVDFFPFPPCVPAVRSYSFARVLCYFIFRLVVSTLPRPSSPSRPAASPNHAPPPSLPLASRRVRSSACFLVLVPHTLSRSTTLQNCSMCVYGCLVQYKSPSISSSLYDSRPNARACQLNS